MELVEKVLSVNERPTISQGGQPQNNIVIEFITVHGTSGSLTIPEREYATLDPEALAERLEEKASLLDRPFML